MQDYADGIDVRRANKISFAASGAALYIPEIVLVS